MPADATRRDIVRRTLDTTASVSELAAAYDMSFAAVQKHVAVLEDAGLITKERSGRSRIVRGEAAALRRAQQLLAQLEAVWVHRDAGLAALPAETPTV